MTDKFGWGAKAAQAAKSAASSSVPTSDTGTEGRGESHQRHPVFCLRIERPSGNSQSIMYGTFVGAPQHYPSIGIQFVFEAAHPKHGWYDPATKNRPWVIARWCVSIHGRNLKPVYDHLCDCKEVFLRISEDEDEGKPCITEVSIDEMEIEISGTMGKKR